MTDREQIAKEMYLILGIKTAEDRYYFGYEDKFELLINWHINQLEIAKAEGARETAERISKAGLADDSLLWVDYG
jgi:hypothetical protein